jgi:hypothetical protein
MRATEAITNGEPEGAEFICWWDNLNTLNGGLEGPKTWAQMKRVAVKILTKEGFEISNRREEV